MKRRTTKFTIRRYNKVLEVNLYFKREIIYRSMCDNNIIIHHYLLTRYQQRESDEDDVVATKILR